MSTLALSRPIELVRERWLSLVGWWFFSRLVTLGAFLVLDALGPRGQLGAMYYREPFQLLTSWDAVWYDRVAQHGYIAVPGAQSDTAFFPLFPIMLRILHAVFGLPFTVGGPLIANLMLLVAVIAFYELSVRVLRDEEVSRRASIFLVIAPMSYVFSMGYPESFALAVSLLALLAALADRWLLVTLCAAAAVLARPEVVVVAVPIAGIAWSHRALLSPERRGAALAAVLAAPAAVFSFPLYLQWALHDADAWGQAQKSWGRAFRLDGPLRAFEHIPRKVTYLPVLPRDLVFLVVYALLLWVAARRGIAWYWLLAGALILILPLFSGSVESVGRFGLFALPIYWALAMITRRRRVERAVQALSLAMLVTLVLFLPTVWP